MKVKSSSKKDFSMNRLITVSAISMIFVLSACSHSEMNESQEKPVSNSKTESSAKGSQPKVIELTDSKLSTDPSSLTVNWLREMSISRFISFS